jgi:hypothetical protein
MTDTNPQNQPEHSPSILAAQALLRTAERSWTTITGELRTWADEDLLDEGRRQFHGEDSDPSDADPSDGEEENYEGQYTTVHRFWATRTPWRVRLDRLRDDYSDREASRGSPDTLIIHESTWWAEYGGRRVATNVGSQHLHTVWGTHNLSLMLRPTPVVMGFRFREARMAETAGRRSIRLSAVPRTSPQDLVWHVGELVALGASDYIITVDAQYGIILGAEAHINGRLARKEEIVFASIDTPSASDLFTPRTPGPIPPM